MIIVLGPQRRPTLDAVGLDGAGRDDHGGLAGTRARRRRARRAAGRPQPSTWPCTPAGRTCSSRDPEYAAAERAHRAALAEQQELHLVQLDGVLGALREVARRGGSGPRVRDEARADAEAVVRLVDDRHLARVAQERAAFARPVAARRSARRWRAHRARGRRACWREPRRWPSRAATSGCWGTCCGCSPSSRPPDRRRLVGRGDGADRPGAALPRPRRARAVARRVRRRRGWAGSPARCCCRTPGGGCASTTRCGWPSWPCGPRPPAA